VLSSDVVVACPGGPGTVSEIALALKYSKPVILLDHSKEAWLTAFEASGKLQYASSPEDVIEKILSLV
jgi:predicted Rossmann-fold nucleotide-binding protein